LRQIILDTETTGLNAKLGDRIIEIGCIELVNRRFTGNNLHHYLNPERSIEAGAKQVHGISEEFLADKPRFAEVAADLMAYLRGAEIIIHNAAFDVEFLDAELALASLPELAAHEVKVTDTLKIARELHPGKRNSLDALCDRYEVSNAHRTLHGALLDAELLAEVYLAMTRGQDSLLMDAEVLTGAVLAGASQTARLAIPLLVLQASEDELAAHEKSLAAIDKESKGKCMWLKLEQAEAEGEAQAA
jgi:DNA polymerase-3 subunit epsilon